MNNGPFIGHLPCFTMDFTYEDYEDGDFPLQTVNVDQKGFKQEKWWNDGDIMGYR